MLDLIENIQL